MVLKGYRFQKRAFLFTVHGVNDVSVDAIVALAKQEQTHGV